MANCNSLQLSKKSQRNSSIELLRIISACAVITLHFIGMGNVIDLSSGFTREIMILIESFCVCAVDVFIMISGYFLSTSNKRTWDKPLYIYLTLAVIVMASYVVGCLLNGTTISPITLIHSVIPPKNYFVLLYITLYIISPYLNLVINNLDDKHFRTFIVLAIVVFSVYPTLMDSYQHLIHTEVMGVSTIGAWGQQHGYTIVNFLLCYCIGAFIRRYGAGAGVSKKGLVCISLLCVAAIYIWFHASNYISKGSQTLVECNALSYSNPFVLLLSATLLILFSRTEFKSKVINKLAKASFVCYLFNLVALPQMGIGNYVKTGGALFILLIISIIVIYLASYFIWLLINAVISPLTNKLSSKSIIKFD